VKSTIKDTNISVNWISKHYIYQGQIENNKTELGNGKRDE
jgi:hypothetical protein